MANSYTDEEKQAVQRLCSYGIVAAIFFFEQAALKFKPEKQVSVLYEPQWQPKPSYSDRNKLQHSAGFWEIRTEF